MSQGGEEEKIGEAWGNKAWLSVLCFTPPHPQPAECRPLGQTLQACGDLTQAGLNQFFSLLEMDRIYSNQSCCSCSEEGKIFHIDQRSMSVFQQQCRPHLQALFLLLLLFENCSCLLFKSSNQTSVTTAVDAFWVSDLS